MTWTVLFAAPAAVGFAVLFNVRRRALLPIAALAVIAKSVAVLLVGEDMSVVFASFVAALLVGVVAYTLGPATGEAAPVYGFASVVPLIPGIYVFQALQALESVVIARSGGVQALNPLIDAATNGITAAGILLALAIGVTSPVLLLPGTRTPED
ncbi:MAG: threonine/serine exporter family protein [Actinobacteria bacterium]|nr:threonine/serine exporter family protein [Actinomycetota bacterium]MCB9425163.1 threonine/serine exporter family protein [Actinomycetota bacterium]HRY09317.1 threonine/serine exporter family protein [Candidatus Nanopelagicales bacterium]